VEDEVERIEEEVYLMSISSYAANREGRGGGDGGNKMVGDTVPKLG
jgi:hypothetical protein